MDDFHVGYQEPYGSIRMHLLLFKAQVSHAGLISKRMDCISIQNPKHHYQNPRRR